MQVQTGLAFFINRFSTKLKLTTQQKQKKFLLFHLDQEEEYKEFRNIFIL